MLGKVVSFHDGKGYGFIRCDDGSGDQFVHYSEINMRGYRTLAKGQLVEFEVEASKINNKMQAVNVRPIGESDGSRGSEDRGK